MSSEPVLSDIMAFAEKLALESAKVTLPLFRTALVANNKAADGDFDPVTDADRKAEEVMRELIRTHYRDHGIEGEEYGSERLDADYVWVLDPIDGTRAFISGLPLWGTLIGLKFKDKPVFGLMHQPFIGETFSGAMFAGTNPLAQYKHGTMRQILRSRDCPGLAAATISATTPHMFMGSNREAYERVEQQCRLVRYGYDCYAYAALAAGHIDLVVEAGLKPCDIVALVPIIQAAGGIITSWTGGPVTEGGTVIAAGDPRIHEEALALLVG